MGRTGADMLGTADTSLTAPGWESSSLSERVSSFSLRTSESAGVGGSEKGARSG
jgi:hypothetical protein